MAYESRKLEEHERNYSTHDLDLDAIIHALNIWWHYLIGRKYLLILDKISLKYLFDQQNLNARQARWLSILSEYDFEIKHINGTEKKVADSLSHQANLLFPSSNYELDLENKILNAEKFDKEY